MTAEQRQSKTILIVEDEPPIAQIVRVNLMLEGFSGAIVIAEDGIKGWVAYQKSRPDLVITDVMMPGISGFDLLMCIRKMDQAVPVIVFDAMDGVERSLALGANAHIRKPFEPEVLMMIVQACLDGAVIPRDVSILCTMLSDLHGASSRFFDETKREIARLCGRGDGP